MAAKKHRSQGKREPAAPRAPVAPPVSAAPVWVRRLVGGLAVTGLLLLAGALIVSLNQAEAADRLSRAGWGELGARIVDLRAVALGHGGLMFLAAAGFAWFFLMARGGLRGARAAASALVLIVAGDALWLSRHYVQTMPPSFIRENEAVRILKAGLGSQRVMLASQGGFYNAWLTYLLPYHGIPTLNVTQMPRMPTDYKLFLDAVGNNPLRLWQLSAVGLIMGPSQIVQELQRDPRSAGAFDVIFAYNVEPAAGENFEVAPATTEQPGKHVILRFKKPAARYAALGAWRTATDEEALQVLKSDAYEPFEVALISADAGVSLPPSTGKGLVGEVSVKERTASHARLRVSVERDAVLRIAERYDADWKAWIDGKPAPLFRCDFICQGVLVPAGMHEVELRYAPPVTSLWLQLAAIGTALASAVALVMRRRSAMPISGFAQPRRPDAGAGLG